MVGHIPQNLREGLRELLIGVGTRDSQRVVHAYQQMDILLPNADLTMLERANSRIFERYWGKNMAELTNLNTHDLKVFMDEFRDLLYDLPFQIPQDLIFLVRCVGILAGICIGLDSQFNIFEHLAPYTQKLIADDVRTNRKEWLGEIENLARGWLSMPGKVDALLARLERGDISIRNPEVSLQIARLERAIRLLGAGFVFLAFMIGGVLFYVNNFIPAAIVLFGSALISLFWIFWKNIIFP
jgi:predicted unusual protein kinase regulating ubiquinone biosynthesis (AarF/ABC1/UbiB family)